MVALGDHLGAFGAVLDGAPTLLVPLGGGDDDDYDAYEDAVVAWEAY